MKSYKTEFDYRYKDADDYFTLWIRARPLGEKICDCVGNEAGRKGKDYVKSADVCAERITGLSTRNLTVEDLKSDKYYQQRKEALVTRIMNENTLTELQARSLANCVLGEMSKKSEKLVDIDLDAIIISCPNKLNLKLETKK